jgi:hypothetical protein
MTHRLFKKIALIIIFIIKIYFASSQPSYLLKDINSVTIVETVSAFQISWKLLVSY